jgi:hypothetical protein
MHDNHIQIIVPLYSTLPLPFSWTELFDGERMMEIAEADCCKCCVEKHELKKCVLAMYTHIRTFNILQLALIKCPSLALSMQRKLLRSRQW